MVFSMSLLVSDGVLNVSPLSLQISHGVLGHLEVALNLPLLLLSSSPALLLLVQTSLQLGLSGRQMLLLLVQLADNLVLLGNLILQGLDGVIPVTLFLLHLGDGELNVLDILLHSSNAAGVGLDIGSEGNPGVLLGLQDLHLSGQLGLRAGLDRESLGLSVSVDRDAALLLRQLLGHGTDLVLQSSHVALQLGGLVQSGFVFAVGGIGLLLQLSQ